MYADRIWRQGGAAGQLGLLGLLLAGGVVGWQVGIHQALGAHGAGAGVALWLRDSLLAWPLGLVAVWGGRQLAARGRQRDSLLAHALFTAGLFTLLLLPALAWYAAAAPQAGPLVVHLLRDGLLVFTAAVPLALLGLVLLDGRWSVRWVPPAEPWGRVALVGAVVVPVVAALALPNVAPAAQGRTRTYYIAADEVDWNYAPSEINQFTGKSYSASDMTWLEQGPGRIGRVYRKALFREYTDASFTQLKPRPPEWEHLGALGPPIYAEVGDTIEVVFKNNTRYAFSVHAHGVLYTKEHEGAVYNDGRPADSRPGASIPPGETYTYIWQVPERAGPGPMDPSSVLWMYHSHVGEVTDTNTGLVGPLIVTRRGSARPDGRPADVDREVITLLNVYDENKSLYLDDNIRRFTTRPQRVKKDDAEFQESNRKHTINGYLFASMPAIVLQRGERVRWYLFALGSEEGLHSAHWHGQTVLWHGMRMDGVELMPMSMKTVDLVPDALGTWLFHCHVNDHIIGGMMALFTVRP